MPGSRGELLWNVDKLDTMCSELDKNKFQIHVHAIGDAATSVTLDAFGFAEEQNGKRDSRNLITHLQLVDSDIIRFKELGVVAFRSRIGLRKMIIIIIFRCHTRSEACR